MALFAAQPEEPTEVESEEEEPEEEQVEETAETEEPEEEETEGEESEDENDPEEGEELPATSKKANAAFAKMRRDFQALQAELAQLKASKEADTPEPEEDGEPNPFSAVTTLKDLKTQKASLTQTLERTEELLDDNEDAHSDDVIYSDGGKEYTKRQIKAANRNARKALDKHIPAQQKAIELSEQRVQMREAFYAKALEEVPAIADEKSPVKAAFEALQGSPVLAKVAQLVPELAPEIPWIAAHVANSLHGGKRAISKAVVVPAKKPLGKIPASPTASSTTSSNRSVAGEKAAAKARERFEKTGSVDDLARMFM